MHNILPVEENITGPHSNAAWGKDPQINIHMFVSNMGIFICIFIHLSPSLSSTFIYIYMSLLCPGTSHPVTLSRVFFSVCKTRGVSSLPAFHHPIFILFGSASSDSSLSRSCEWSVCSGSCVFSFCSFAFSFSCSWCLGGAWVRSSSCSWCLGGAWVWSSSCSWCLGGAWVWSSSSLASSGGSVRLCGGNPNGLRGRTLHGGGGTKMPFPANPPFPSSAPLSWSIAPAPLSGMGELPFHFPHVSASGSSSTQTQRPDHFLFFPPVPHAAPRPEAMASSVSVRVSFFTDRDIVIYMCTYIYNIVTLVVYVSVCSRGHTPTKKDAYVYCL